MTPQIALQLYTVREPLKTDLVGTLRRVAEMGYTAVETAFWEPEVTPQDARRLLDEFGLRVMSVHCDLPLGDKRDNALALADIYGCDRLVWHGWPRDPRYSSLEGIDSLVNDYNTANQAVQAAGLKLGLHNHWWECELVNGVRPYQVLLERCDPSIFFELDTYWATVGGADPVAVLGEMGARAQLLHIKDGPANSQDALKVAVGTGAMDIPALLAAANHAEWLVVELDDCATDIRDAAAESYRYLHDTLHHAH
jgi:sugar phosphate isomerase/epimerase